MPDDFSPEEQKLAEQLAPLRDLTPSPAFQQRMTPTQLRRRLRTTPTRARHAVRRGWGAPTWIAVACALVLFFSSTGYAAAASLPGDRLYSLKEMIEQIQLALTSGEAHTALERELLNRRLYELDVLIDRHADQARISAGVSAYRRALDRTADDGLDPHLQSRHLEALRELRNEIDPSVRAALQTVIVKVEDSGTDDLPDQPLPVQTPLPTQAAPEPSRQNSTPPPGDPGRPADPGQPGDPGRPEDPGRPADPGQPGDPGRPEDPGQPGSPGRPEDPGQPGNPGRPEDPGQPGDPGRPEDPGQPGNPGRPEDPGQPGDPGKPEDPGQPGDPGRPEDPGQPGDPGKPEDPGQTGDPGKPEDPGQPGDPGKPEDPGQPGDPGKPEDPGQPGDPGKPEDPGQPGDPGKPEKPGKPKP